MKKKIILISIAIIIILVALGGYLYIRLINAGIANGMFLDTDNYLTSIEVKTSNNFILYINKDKKIANIIFLDNDSIKVLYNKGIEGQNIDKGIKTIIELFSKDNKFLDNKTFTLINYGDDSTYSEVKEEFNKEFVVYGIDKNISEEKSTLSNKSNELGYEGVTDTEVLKELYYSSLDLINNYYSMNNKKYTEENLQDFSKNIYLKLQKYAKTVNNQKKDENSKLDIRSINSTEDYNNPIYPSDGSWYYIEDSKVYADIIFNYNNNKYEYCYKGNTEVIKGSC